MPIPLHSNPIMSFTSRSRLSVPRMAALIALAFSSTGALADTSAGGFDFSYTSRGDRGVWPTQVFDSGAETYFQFPADKTVPAIFAVAPCGRRVLLTPTTSGPYFVVPGMYRNYALQIGPRSASIDYTGQKDIPLEKNVANEPNCQARSTSGGVARPMREHTAIAPRFGDDPFNRSVDTVNAKNHIVAQKPAKPSPTVAAVSAVAAPSVAVRDGTSAVAAPAVLPAEVALVAPPLPLPVWEIRIADGTLSNAMRRWVTANRGTLLWQAQKDYPALAATFSGDLETALSGVMTSLQHADYPLRTCLHENNVVRVMHKSKSCEE